MTEPEHIRRNRETWEKWAADFVEAGEKSWASDEPFWGVWSVPESELEVLPDHLEGRPALEIGCGTAYVSAWMARRGARPTGIDLSKAQLATAKRLQSEHDLSFPLVYGDAEHLPFPDETFDIAISEHGASPWADPHAWIPEAARVLKLGGELIFLWSGTLVYLASPEDGSQPGETLHHDYFEIHRFEWPDWPTVEFHLGYGDTIRLLRANGFDVEDMIEVRPPEGATTTHDMVTRVVAPLAVRRDLEGAKARLIPGEASHPSPY